VSQSPDESSRSQERLDRYDDAWAAIFALVDRGESWSGHERNCCFLNTGGRRFADVSASTGLDFEDDGRAVALVDWDFDGRQDIWVGNRTAPRVRLLRNATRGGGHFLAVRLQGVTCNRDAVGARVEIHRNGDEKLIKTLYAGDGFIGQSSKWVHFGLGNATSIDRLVVRWPGQQPESFEGLKVDSHYELVQGSGTARSWTPPRGRIELVAAPVELPPGTAKARSWLMGRLPMPDATYTTWDGKKVALDEHRGKPLLVNLWSSNCKPCLQEMAEWTKASARLRGAPLQVVCASVDGLYGSSPGTTERAAEKARSLIKRLAFPFASGSANPDLADAMEVVHRFYFESQRPLPIPTSFLLDRHGRVAAIYKGPVSPERLLSDVKLLNESLEKQRDAALPFSGRWMSKPTSANPRPLVALYVKSGRHDEAIAYLVKYLAIQEKVPVGYAADWNRGRAALYRTLGDLYFSQNKPVEALDAYRNLMRHGPNDVKQHVEVAKKMLLLDAGTEGLGPTAATRYLESSLKLNPEHPELRFAMAMVFLDTGEHARAVEQLRAIVDRQPRDGGAHLHLAKALLAGGDPRGAVDHYRISDQLIPNATPANELAWILATHRDAGIRDGPEAVRLAEGLCRRQGFKNPATLATLGASYAEAGRFDDAVRVTTNAIELANSASMENLVRTLEEHLSLYQSRQPARD